MKREEERLIPVKSESELRPGMLVVCRPCLLCGRAHRALLLESRIKHVSTRAVVDGALIPAGDLEWRLTPTPCCWKTDNEWAWFARGVRQGIVFRVDTGLQDEASPYVAVALPKRGVVSR